MFDLLTTSGKDQPPVRIADNHHVRLDHAAGSFLIDTERTAGGFVPSGRLVAGALSFDVGSDPATVWASSLDGRPLTESGRILVSHLTDVQADGNTYADRTKRVLLKWGTVPVVRCGRARISLARANPAPCAVWAIGTDGTRLERLPAKCADGRLSFAADVAGRGGARMMYEIITETN